MRVEAAVVSAWIAAGLIYDIFVEKIEAKRFSCLSFVMLSCIACLRDIYVNSMAFDQSLVADLMLRFIMASYLLAFISLYYQAEGLSGSYGLIPLSSALRKSKLWHADFVDSGKGKARGVRIFMLRHLIYAINSLYESAGSVVMVCVYGIGVSGYGTFFTPNPLTFAFTYVCYFGARRFLPEFFNLQWDALLLEAGVYGFLLSSLSMLAGGDLASVGIAASACITLFKILLFRLMFGSGMVKYFSGDVSWRDGTAMDYHFLTQPLPGIIAPLLHAQPAFMRKLSCHLALFVCELAVPLMSLLVMGLPFPEESVPALNMGIFAVYGILQLAIATGGNFGFFNFLSQALALCLLQDTILNNCVQTLGVDLGVGALKRGGGNVLLIPAWVTVVLVLPWAVLLLFINVTSIVKLLKHCNLIPDPETFCPVSVLSTPGTTPLFAVGTPRSSGFASAAVSSPTSSRGSSQASLSSPTSSSSSSISSVSDHGDNHHLSSPSLPAESATRSYDSYYRMRIRAAAHSLLGATYAWSLSLHSLLSVFSVGCHYGLFAHMTKTRHEILVEVSHDYADILEGNWKERDTKVEKGDALTAEEMATWTPLSFKYKPGSCSTEKSIKAVAWPPLHMPRLDWRLWFIPLNGNVQGLAHAAVAMRAKQSAQRKAACSDDEKATARRIEKASTAYYVQKAAKVLPRWLLQFLCGVLENDKAVLSLISYQSPAPTSAPVPASSGVRMLTGDEVLQNKSHIRLRLARYTYSPPNLSTLTGLESVWHISEHKPLLPPLDLGMLFTLLDEKDDITVASSQMTTDAQKEARLAQLPAEMRPETAAEIIQRMMSKGRS